MKELNELRKKENTRIEEVAAKKSKKEQRLDNNSLFGEFKEEQELYKEKTAGNKFTKADYNSGKVVRKNREADTMAMLKGFRSTLFDAKEIEGKLKTASSSKIANSSGEIPRLAETHAPTRNNDARRKAKYSRS